MLRVDFIQQVGGINVLARGQVQSILIAQNFLASLVDNALAQFPVGDGSLDGCDFVIDVLGHEQHIVACQQSVDARRTLKHLGGTLHVEGIGEDETVKVQLVAQHIVHTARRQACRCRTSVDGGYQQVGGEDAAQSGIDKTAEGHQFAGVDFLNGFVDDGQCLVGVFTRVAMTREVLAHCHHASVLQTARKGDGMACHQFGTLAEGTVADDGVQRIIIHVKHWSKVHLDAHAAALACHLTTVFIEQNVIVDGSQDEVAREVGHLLEPHSQSPFSVDGNHQRDGGE